MSKTIAYIKVQPMHFDTLVKLYAIEKGKDTDTLTPYQLRQLQTGVRSILYKHCDHISITGKGKNIYHYNK
jgi:hypothetical protein